MTRMSALGQKQTSAHVRVMSALPPKAELDQQACDVRFVPQADITPLIRSARWLALTEEAGWKYRVPLRS